MPSFKTATIAHIFGVAWVAMTTLFASDAWSQPPSANSRWIVGNWAKLNENSRAASCASDFGASFNRDGSYDGYLEKGRWILAAGRLTITIDRSNYASGGEGPMLRLKKPEIRTMTVTRVGLDMKVDKDIFVRC